MGRGAQTGQVAEVAANGRGTSKRYLEDGDIGREQKKARTDGGAAVHASVTTAATGIWTVSKLDDPTSEPPALVVPGSQPRAGQQKQSPLQQQHQGTSQHTMGQFGDDLASRNLVIQGTKQLDVEYTIKRDIARDRLTPLQIAEPMIQLLDSNASFDDLIVERKKFRIRIRNLPVVPGEQRSTSFPKADMGLPGIRKTVKEMRVKIDTWLWMSGEEPFELCPTLDFIFDELAENNTMEERRLFEGRVLLEKSRLKKEMGRQKKMGLPQLRQQSFEEVVAAREALETSAVDLGRQMESLGFQPIASSRRSPKAKSVASRNMMRNVVSALQTVRRIVVDVTNKAHNSVSVFQEAQLKILAKRREERARLSKKLGLTKDELADMARTYPVFEAIRAWTPEIPGELVDAGIMLSMLYKKGSGWKRAKEELEELEKLRLNGDSSGTGTTKQSDVRVAAEGSSENLLRADESADPGPQAPSVVGGGFQDPLFWQKFHKNVSAGKRANQNSGLILERRQDNVPGNRKSEDGPQHSSTVGATYKPKGDVGSIGPAESAEGNTLVENGLQSPLFWQNFHKKLGRRWTPKESTLKSDPASKNGSRDIGSSSVAETVPQSGNSEGQSNAVPQPPRIPTKFVVLTKAERKKLREELSEAEDLEEVTLKIKTYLWLLGPTRKREKRLQEDLASRKTFLSNLVNSRIPSLGNDERSVKKTDG